VNLTATPAADEALLLTQGARAVFVTVGRSRVLSVTALEGLAGREATTRPRGFGPRLRTLSLEGSAAPLGRTDFLLKDAVGRAEIVLDDERLSIDLGDAAGTAVYDFARRAFSDPGRGALRIVARDVSEPPLLLATVDRARDVLGSGLVRTLGRWLLAARRVVAWPFSGRVSSERPRAIVHPFVAGAGRQSSGHESTDPLLRVQVLHPDGASKDAGLVLVTLDMRQLELGFVAGTERPWASAGVPGEGRLPRDPAARSSIVACFNGGGERADERLGAMEARRLLAQPVRERPSLIVTSGHELLLGKWPFDESVPDHVVAFTQRNATLEEGSSSLAMAPARGARRRSALCATEAGELVYAYGEALERDVFARTLSRSGCIYTLPLAASPERLGLSLVRASSRGVEAVPVDAKMDFDARAAEHGSTRDFFYLMRRRSTPEIGGGIELRPDGGAQPPPASLPGLFTAEMPLGSLRVQLFAIERGRVDYRLRAGPLEIGARGEPWAGAFPSEDAARALAVLELGHATAANRFGLVLGEAIPLPIRAGYATLVIGNAGAVRVLLPGEAVTLGHGEQAVQLPLLADGRDVTERARERGATRERAALCVADGRRLLVASAKHDSSDPLAVALRTAGCKRVVELDRGSHHPAFIHRSGTETPPESDYESTTLWALARPMRPAVDVLSESP
jgi:hypothetical protein